MKREYFVYQHVTPDGMYYFGVTKNVHQRWQQSKYKNCSLFPYIDKYGWDNIQHNILMSELTYEEARKIENMLIESAREDGVCINQMRSGLISKDIKKYQNEWYSDNIEKTREKRNEHDRIYRRKLREENREAVNEYKRKIYSLNREEINRKRREKYAKNKTTLFLQPNY